MWYDWNALGVFGWTMMILLWAAVIFLVIWGIRAAGTSKDSLTPDAVELLRRRYAAGEIDGDEYEQRRRTLEDSKIESRQG